ncbi:MAG: hypothetical protein QX189_10555 [Methylococcales bacterium]
MNVNIVSFPNSSLETRHSNPFAGQVIQSAQHILIPIRFPIYPKHCASLSTALIKPPQRVQQPFADLINVVAADS